MHHHLKMTQVQVTMEQVLMVIGWFGRRKQFYLSMDIADQPDSVYDNFCLIWTFGWIKPEELRTKDREGENEQYREENSLFLNDKEVNKHSRCCSLRFPATEFLITQRSDIVSRKTLSVQWSLQDFARNRETIVKNSRTCRHRTNPAWNTLQHRAYPAWSYSSTSR